MNPVELARDWQLALVKALHIPTRTESHVIISDCGLEAWFFNGVVKILDKEELDVCTIENELRKLKSYSWKYETTSAPWYLAKVLTEYVLAPFEPQFPVFVRDLGSDDPKTTEYADFEVTIKKVRTEAEFKAWESYLAKRYELWPALKEIYSVFFWEAVKRGHISCYSAVGEDGKVKATGAISFYNGAAYISNGTFKEEVYGAHLDQHLIKVAKKANACALVEMCQPEKAPYMEGQGYTHVTNYQWFKTECG